MTNAQKKPKKGLGRGLSALISQTPVSVVPPQQSPQLPSNRSINQALQDNFEAHGEQPPKPTKTAEPVANEGSVATERIRYIPTESIHNNPKQPRQIFDEKEIEELADSIKTLGVLQPILLRKRPEGEGYEIVAGERRWRAAKRANLAQVPATIRDLDDRLTLEIAIVENVQRSNLSPIEEAEAYKRLIDEFSLTQKQVAEKVGKDRVTISNTLRLLSLPKQILDLIGQEKITVGHAKAILTVKEPSAQLSLAKKVIAENLSVRALENIVSRVVVLDTGKSQESPEKSKKTASTKSAFPDLVDRLRKSLATKVAIKHQPSGRGKIEIDYFSEDELDRLIDKLL